jgi:hypothetical protein
MENNNTPVTGILELLHSGEPANIELARLVYPSATGLTSEWDFLERFCPALAKCGNYKAIQGREQNSGYIAHLKSKCFDWFSNDRATRNSAPYLRVWESVEFGEFFPKYMYELNVYRIAEKSRNGTRAGQVLGLHNTDIKLLNLRDFNGLGFPDFGKQSLPIHRICAYNTLLSEQDILNLPDMPNLNFIFADTVREGLDLSVFARFPKAHIELITKKEFTFGQVKTAILAGVAWRNLGGIKMSKITREHGSNFWLMRELKEKFGNLNAKNLQ